MAAGCWLLATEDEPRQIASGLRAYYSAEEMLGQRLVTVCNLKPRKLMGFPSHGMVLCAMDTASGAVEIVNAHETTRAGDRVALELDSLSSERKEAEAQQTAWPPASANQVKKQKVWEAVQPQLTTSVCGEALFAGTRLVAGGLPLVAPTIRGGVIS